MKKIILMGVVLALAIFSISLFSNSTGFFIVGESDTIKIGYIGPLTGPVANLGISTRNSIELANYQNNNKFTIIYEDGKCDPITALNAAKKLIELDRVDIIISGVCTSSILAIAPLTQENKMIHITPVAGNPLVAKAGDYIYRVSTSSGILAANAARASYEIGARRVGVMFELNDYPIGWKEIFKREFENLGGEIVLEEGFTFGSNDTKIQLMKLNSQDIDSIVLVTLSASSAVKMAKETKELGIEKRLIGSETFPLSQTTRGAKDSLNGFFAIDYSYSKESDQFKNFVRNYENYFGEELPEEYFGALAYDTYTLLSEGINICDKNSDCIKSYFDNAGQRNGLAGEYYFDKDGSAIRESTLKEFVNGEFILVD